MPPSDTVNKSATDNTIAVLAEALYLSNLLVIPGIAFGGLIIIYMRHVKSCNALCRCHLKQTLKASIWAGVLIIVVNGVILVFGGYDEPWTWVLLIIYFTTIHATLVLLGVVGLAKALAEKHYHYPLIGAHCDHETAS